jgi:hypothetical protein
VTAAPDSEKPSEDVAEAAPKAAAVTKQAPEPATTKALDLTGDQPVPKIPRGRGLKLSSGQMLRIGLTAAMLVMLILMTKPCSNAVSSFVTNFGDDGSASDRMPKPGALGMPHPKTDMGSAADYEHISNMTDDERKAAIERSRAKAAAAAAAAGSAGSGSSAAP